MRKYKLQLMKRGFEYVSVFFDTKVEAIEAMNKAILETNEFYGYTEEGGLSPFDFNL